LTDRAFWLAWAQIPGIGPILLKRLRQQFGSLAQAWAANAKALMEVEGVGPQTVEVIVAARSQCDPANLLHQHEQDNPQFITPADPEYPRLLLEIADPPAVLYYRGHLEWLAQWSQTPGIAIVGTRAPSDYGNRWTRRLTKTLAQNGFAIVSGLAEGIDTEAHRSCLAAGGKTLAVLGNGVDVIYPWSNRQLYQQILEQGLILSEYPDGTQPDRVYFPRRNRIVAGLCRATLVLEAPAKSGALITAHLANDYGRDVYALPGSLDNAKSQGCLNLIKKGAEMILSEADLLDMLGSMPQLSLFDLIPEPATPPSPPPDLSPDLAQVLQAIITLTRTQETTTFDLIVQQTGMTAAMVSSATFDLEMLDLITQLPGMRYQMID
jgi:DNA processing protein